MKTKEHTYLSADHMFRCRITDGTGAVPEDSRTAIDIACGTASRIKAAFGISFGYASITVPVTTKPGRGKQTASISFSYDLVFKPVSGCPAIALMDQSALESSPVKGWIHIHAWDGPDDYAGILWDQAGCAFSVHIPEQDLPETKG